MKATIDTLKPGDVFAVHSGNNYDVIQFGESLMGEPNMDNHVAGFVKWDGKVPWGLEGRPGGVGWVDMRKYIGHPFAYNNVAQNRTEATRVTVASEAVEMIGTKYDWEMIGGSALGALHVKLYNLTWPHGLVPGEVVCSSYWAYLYDTVQWAHPNTGDERQCDPGDWTNFIIKNNFHVGFDKL
jgi:hypothetical protein